MVGKSQKSTRVEIEGLTVDVLDDPTPLSDAGRAPGKTDRPAAALRRSRSGDDVRHLLDDDDVDDEASDSQEHAPDHLPFEEPDIGGVAGGCRS